jgi:hypothetical protein
MAREVNMKVKKEIDFTKIEWDRLDQEKLQFFFKEAVDCNDTLLYDINNLNSKAFQLLSILFPVLSAAIGFLLAIWGKEGKEPITIALIVASVGMILIVASLLLAVFPRQVYPGRLAPNMIFANSLYKAPITKLLADGIASYNSYIASNYNVMKYRGLFLTIGTSGIFLVPLITVVVFLICLQN